MSVLKESEPTERRRRKILDNAEDRFAKISGVAATIRSDELEEERRERRRQKILKNAEARLAKITGLSKSSLVDGEVTGGSSKVEKGRARGSSLINSAPQVSFSRNVTHRAETEEVIPEWPRNRQEVTIRQEKKSVVSKMLSLLQWVVLAAAVRLLLFSEYGLMFGENIFLPFVVMEFTVIIARRVLDKNTQLGGTVNALLLLCGVNARTTRLFTEGAGITSNLVKDLGVYIVSFILIHCTAEISVGEMISAIIDP